MNKLIPLVEHGPDTKRCEKDGKCRENKDPNVMSSRVQLLNIHPKDGSGKTEWDEDESKNRN